MEAIDSKIEQIKNTSHKSFCICSSEVNRMLIAKTDKNNSQLGLPLWMHLTDTAGVIKKLIQEWLSDAVFTAAGLSRDLFTGIAVFTAAVHDIGKATSYFQSMITKSLPEQRDGLTYAGFPIYDDFLHKGKTPHAWAGQWILQHKVEDNNKGKRKPKGFINIVGAHHGKPVTTVALNTDPDLLNNYPANFYGPQQEHDEKVLWERCWEQIIEMGVGMSGFASMEDIPSISVQAQVLLTGLLIVADWIASNTHYFPLIPFESFSEVSTDVYPERIEEGWTRVMFPEKWTSWTYRMDENLFKERFGYHPNSIQKAVLEVINTCREPGILILEAPMGTGKTEAAFGAVEVLARRGNSHGVFFGLPTQATSNGLFGRLYDWASNVSSDTINAIRLAHGASGFHEEYNRLWFQGESQVDVEETDNGMMIHPWFQGNKKALLADFVIGTVDQFLMATLKRKHFMLRHLGLAGKVIVIDECHAYDAYMNTYLECSIQWMAAYGVPVILLSATLPRERRRKLIKTYLNAYVKYHLHSKNKEVIEEDNQWKKSIAYPVLTWSQGTSIKQMSIPFTDKTKEIRIERIHSEQDMVVLIQNRLSAGGCACIIVNTVRKAQEIYQRLKETLHEYEMILYHAQFTIEDRLKKEKYLLSKLGKQSDENIRNKVILIGTQVLEQSLDYDVDMMITQLCPMDLLLQRIGRLHRHERSRPESLREPVCYIIEDGLEVFDPGSKSVYGEYLLKKTIQSLPKTIQLPADISRLVEKVYDISDRETNENTPGFECYEKELKNKKERANRNILKMPFGNNGIENILRDEDPTLEKYADTGVRDAVSSIEVLLMKKEDTEHIGFVDREEVSQILSYDTPDLEMGRMIAREKIRLPHILSMPHNIVDTIRELEERNIRELPDWQQCSWIQGELVLLLDKHNQTTVGNYRVSYSREKGLECWKEEE